MFIIIN